VQGLVGHAGVVTARIGGGRMLTDRQYWVPWGDDAVAAPGRGVDRPWAGSLDGLAPATVYRDVRPVRLLCAAGRPVTADDRGVLTSVPVSFVPPGPGGAPSGDGHRRVVAWAGPWPVQERWWDAAGSALVQRVQILEDTGDAWLLALDARGWRAEGRYD
jgi:protein ImuB